MSAEEIEAHETVPPFALARETHPPALILSWRVSGKGRDTGRTCARVAHQGGVCMPAVTLVWLNRNQHDQRRQHT